MTKKKKKPKIITASLVPFEPTQEYMERLRIAYNTCTYEEKKEILNSIFPDCFDHDGKFYFSIEALHEYFPNGSEEEIVGFLRYMFGVDPKEETLIRMQ